MSSTIRSHFELDVYKRAFEVAMRIFQHSKSFPKHEQFSLTDQLRRSSRSVCANLAEAWRKRRYRNHFISKLSDSEGETAETQTWVQFAVKCEYLERSIGVEFHNECEVVIKMIVTMIKKCDDWIIHAG